MGSFTMILMLFQVLFLLISPSLSFKGITPPYPTRGSNVKMWINTPKNMEMLWNIGKRIVDDLPPPRNINELERMRFTLGDITFKQLKLLKAVAEGSHPSIEPKLEALGTEPDEGVLQKLLVAESEPHMHQILGSPSD